MGNLVQYQKAKYTMNTQTSTAGGWLTQVKNTWHDKDMMGAWQTTVLVQNDYTYNNLGLRLTNTVSDNSGPIRTEEYGYDGLSRLTSVDYDDGQTQTYSFDPMGNRTAKTDNVNGNESYTYNNANMLLTRNSSLLKRCKREHHGGRRTIEYLGRV